MNRCPARAVFLFYHDRCFVDVRRTPVDGIARQEARRLAMWCDRSTMWRSLDLSVAALKHVVRHTQATRTCVFVVFGT